MNKENGENEVYLETRNRESHVQENHNEKIRKTMRKKRSLLVIFN